MRHRRLAWFAAALLLAACGGSDSPERSQASDPYAYDRAAPVDYRDGGVLNEEYPVKIHDVSFAGPKGRVPAFLIVPPGRGPYPAAIYLHGAGQDRRAFVLPATWLAGRRAVALLVESPFSPNRGAPLGEGLPAIRGERDRTVQEVIELRRAVDVLQSLPQVDDDRIGFVGYSAGARSGAILSGVERRIRAFVLMSGGEEPVEDYVRLVAEKDRPTVRRLLEETDGLKYIARARPAKLLFQAGRRDEVVPRKALEALIRAGSKPKKVRWYDSGHDLGFAAYRDQLAWLSGVLEIKGPAVPGAVTGPERG